MRTLDLFSGAGGFALGTGRAGWDTLAFCEPDPYCQRILAKHWPDTPIYNDIRTLTYEQLRADGIDTIDAITGGFPCQDLSTAGNQAGISASRSGLWQEYARLIYEIRPLCCIVENVPALITGAGGQWFGSFLGDLASLGYDAEWHCIPAAALGADHVRDRVFVISYPAGLRWEKGQQESGLPQAPLIDVSEFAQLVCTEGQPQWENLPDDTRAADGLPNRLDRMRLMGNAVVPHIPQLLARLITKKLRLG